MRHQPGCITRTVCTCPGPASVKLDDDSARWMGWRDDRTSHQGSDHWLNVTAEAMQRGAVWNETMRTPLPPGWVEWDPATAPANDRRTLTRHEGKLYAYTGDDAYRAGVDAAIARMKPSPTDESVMKNYRRLTRRF